MELLRLFVQACHVGTFIMMICRTYKYMIRPPTGVAERRSGGLFHVMRRIIQGSVSHTIRISRGWLTKD